jgi:hypothetical protein
VLTLDFDPVTQAPATTGLEFTGGDIRFSDVSVRLESWAWIILLGAIDAHSSDLRGQVVTPFPPGTVSGGEFEAADHEAILNHGTITATGSGLFSSVDETIDLSLAPMRGTTDGTGTLDVTLRSAAGSVATYDVGLALPLEVSRVDTNIIEVTITMVGTVVATGQFARLVSEKVPCDEIRYLAGGDVTLEFETELGLYYQVQWCADLNEGAWQNAGDPVPGTGDPVTWTDNGTATDQHPGDVARRYYRIRRRLTP